MFKIGDSDPPENVIHSTKFEYYFLSHLEIVKDVRKEILRRNLIQTR